MRRFWEGNTTVENKAAPRMMALRKNDVRASRNLVGAAEQHVLWKNRLAHHIEGHIKEALDAGLVGQSGICQLGAWIKGAEFHELRGTQAYRELDFAHTLFHQYGAEIMLKLEQGDRAAANAIYKNEYSLAMQHVIQSLTKINLLLQN
ncbi:MAG: CZB domain-containing protein [Gallionella sp.]|nr:CZB domain-containing protein [Gallionella sp.]